MSSTSMTIRLSSDTQEKLARLAERTHRSVSSIAGQAIVDYAERELAIVEGIERGLSDLRNGDVVSHDEAMRRLHKAIGDAAVKG